MASSVVSYEYEEISQDSFRYLVLHPGVHDEPLCCTLHTTEIDNAEYEAISYVWGSEEQPHDILCNDKLLKITSNLNNALRQVRLEDAPRKLWVDSICINQRDLKEKGHQVRMMGGIYSSATCVLVCMDATGSEVAEDVRSLLEDVSNMIVERLYHAIRSIETKESDPDDSDPDDSDPDWLSLPSRLPLLPARHRERGTDQDVNCEVDYGSFVMRHLESRVYHDIFPHMNGNETLNRDPRWALLASFLKQDWFQRGWVVREAGLAKQVLVKWGVTTLSWENLMWTAMWLNRRAGYMMSTQYHNGIGLHLEAYEARHRGLTAAFYQEGGWRECSLLDYVYFARSLRLKDPRDRIYAFLDIVTGDVDKLTSHSIVPNYTDPPAKVFLDFAASYILATEDLNILYYIDYADPATELTTLTWVPSWDSGSMNAKGRMSPNFSLHSRAGQVSSPVITAGNLLQLQGAISDTISFTSNVLCMGDSLVASLLTLWIQVRNLLPPDNPYRGFLLEAFLDTLTSGAHFLGTLLATDSQWKSIRDVFKAVSHHVNDHETIPWESEQFYELNSNPLCRFMVDHMRDRRFIITRRGYFGHAPQIARTGDACAVIFGCCRPCLLRATPAEGSYCFVGTSFVLGSHVSIVGDEPRFLDSFGDDDSPDWKGWDIEEQDIFLV